MNPTSLFSPELVELLRTLIREELASRPLVQTKPALLTVTEAAERAGVKPRTICDWIKVGVLPAQRRGGKKHEAHPVLGGRRAPVHVGGRWLIAPDDLELAIKKPKSAPSKLTPAEQGKRAAECYAQKSLVATRK